MHRNQSEKSLWDNKITCEVLRVNMSGRNDIMIEKVAWVEIPIFYLQGTPYFSISYFLNFISLQKHARNC